MYTRRAKVKEQHLSGDLILLSRVDGPSAAIIQNSGGGLGLLISEEASKIVNTNRTILMYKILLDGKISHVTNDRIVKTLSRCNNVFLEK